MLCTPTDGKRATVICRPIKRIEKSCFNFAYPWEGCTILREINRMSYFRLRFQRITNEQHVCFHTPADYVVSDTGHDILLHYRFAPISFEISFSRQRAVYAMYQCNKRFVLFFFFAGNFKAGPEPGTILKKLCPKEQLCFQVLMNDVLKPYVPEYKGHLTTDDGDRILLIFLKF